VKFVLREFLKRAYEYVAGPLYVRLSRDVTIHTQTALASNLEYQEQSIRKLLDEMARFHLELERLKNRTDQQVLDMPEGRNEETMEKVLMRTDSHLAMVKLANEQQISLPELFEWKSRYGGMSAQVMRKVRRLERENRLLQEENQLMKSTLALLSMDEEVGNFVAIDAKEEIFSGKSRE
jgi:regulator of replication initiation timing